MNKKTLFLYGIIAILSILLVTSFIYLSQTQKNLRILDNFMGVTLHHLSMKNYENGKDFFDLKELVVGNEKSFCEAVEGFWNGDAKECLNISEQHCRLISGNILKSSEKESHCFVN